MKLFVFVSLIAFVGFCFAEETVTPAPAQAPVANATFAPEKDYVLEMGNSHITEFPYTTELKETIQPGFAFHAVGQLTSNPLRVVFNLLRRVGDREDAIFHLSIRFDEGLFVYKAIFNDFINGTWSAKEERIEHPWSESDLLDLRVRVLSDSYVVFGNGKLLGKFDQRVPASEATHVQVDGGLNPLTLLNYAGSYYSNPFLVNAAQFTVGKQLDVTGFVTGDRFSIDLMHKNFQPAINITFDYKDKFVARQSYSKMQWTEPEVSGGFPLEKQRIIEVSMIHEDDGFHIYLNQKHFCNFKHFAEDINDVEFLQVKGDIDLHKLSIHPYHLKSELSSSTTTTTTAAPVTSTKA